MNKNKMIELKNDFLIGEHTLTDDQLELLIEEKFIRAREYQEALKKLEERVLKEFE